MGSGQSRTLQCEVERRKEAETQLQNATIDLRKIEAETQLQNAKINLRKIEAETQLQNATIDLRKIEVEKTSEIVESDNRSKQQDRDFELKKLELEAHIKKDFNSKLSSIWKLMMENKYTPSDVSYVSTILSAGNAGEIDEAMFRAIESKVTKNPSAAKEMVREITKELANKTADIDIDDNDKTVREIIKELAKTAEIDIDESYNDTKRDREINKELSIRTTDIDIDDSDNDDGISLVVDDANDGY